MDIVEENLIKENKYTVDHWSHTTKDPYSDHTLQLGTTLSG